MKERKNKNAKPNFTRKNKSHYNDCKCKKRYKTEYDAESVARIYNQRVYYCQYCNGYHISSRDYYDFDVQWYKKRRGI